MGHFQSAIKPLMHAFSKLFLCASHIHFHTFCIHFYAQRTFFFSLGSQKLTHSVRKFFRPANIPPRSLVSRFSVSCLQDKYHVPRCDFSPSTTPHFGQKVPITLSHPNKSANQLYLLLHPHLLLLLSESQSGCSAPPPPSGPPPHRWHSVY